MKFHDSLQAYSEAACSKIFKLKLVLIKPMYLRLCKLSISETRYFTYDTQ